MTTASSVRGRVAGLEDLLGRIPKQSHKGYANPNTENTVNSEPLNPLTLPRKPVNSPSPSPFPPLSSSLPLSRSPPLPLSPLSPSLPLSLPLSLPPLSPSLPLSPPLSLSPSPPLSLSPSLPLSPSPPLPLSPSLLKPVAHNWQLETGSTYESRGGGGVPQPQPVSRVKSDPRSPTHAEACGGST